MSKQGYFKDYILASLLIQIPEIHIEFCKTLLFSQSQVQKQHPFMWFYAIYDIEVITKRNAPSNVLQNKNHHCTGFAIKRKWEFNLFQQLPVQMQWHRYLEFWDSQQLTGCRNGGGSRINPTCTEFSALKADICESTCLGIHSAASLRAVMLK